MAMTLCPILTSDSNMQRSIDQAFSKYLQVTPTRIMLLHVSAEDEEQRENSPKSFCLKSAVIKCLRGPESRASDKSLEFDALQKLLIKHYASHFKAKDEKSAKEQPEGIDPGPHTQDDPVLSQVENERLYQRLNKLINRHRTLFAKCDRTYSLKHGQRAVEFATPNGEGHPSRS